MALKTFNPTPRQEEPRSQGRWMNPDDFEKKYGYDIRLIHTFKNK